MDPSFWIELQKVLEASKPLSIELSVSVLTLSEGASGSRFTTLSGPQPPANILLQPASLDVSNARTTGPQLAQTAGEAQTVSWSTTVGTELYDYSRAVVSNSQGEIFIAGASRGQMAEAWMRVRTFGSVRFRSVRTLSRQFRFRRSGRESFVLAKRVGSDLVLCVSNQLCLIFFVVYCREGRHVEMGAPAHRNRIAPDFYYGAVGIEIDGCV